jgi:hypothetical protein
MEHADISLVLAGIAALVSSAGILHFHLRSRCCGRVAELDISPKKPEEKKEAPEELSESKV